MAYTQAILMTTRLWKADGPFLVILRMLTRMLADTNVYSTLTRHATLMEYSGRHKKAANGVMMSLLMYTCGMHAAKVDATLLSAAEDICT